MSGVLFERPSTLRLIDSVAFKNGLCISVSLQESQEREREGKKKTHLPVILLKRNSQRDWMKGESLFRMAAFGWSAAWKPSGRDQERPPHVILIQRLVETVQTWFQMQPQGIHFPQPAQSKLFQNACIFLFCPIIKQFNGILGWNKSKWNNFGTSSVSVWVWTSNICA